VSCERTATGIGKEISEKLAKQGINVVIAALEDPLLAKTTVELQKKYPNVQIKKVACNLANTDFMDGLVDATKDLDINVVFNNAGFITVSEPSHAPLHQPHLLYLDHDKPSHAPLHQTHLLYPDHGEQPQFVMLGQSLFVMLGQPHVLW
jgi:NAD(P)-dependent dehydrogenase (short-subunit alcohol dehydrogenase family)